MKFYEFFIDENNEDNGVEAVSLVEKPAIQENFIKLEEQSDALLSEEEKTVKVNYKVVDDEQKIVSGAVLIPNKLIYRSAEQLQGEDGYISMSEDTVRKCAHLYLKRNNNNNVTLDHEEETNKVTLMESWVIDDLSNDKSNYLGYSDLPLGTWMATFKIEDDELWEEVKSGEYNGFSIEGFFQMREVSKTNMSEQNDIYKEILDNLIY